MRISKLTFIPINNNLNIPISAFISYFRLARRQNDAVQIRFNNKNQPGVRKSQNNVCHKTLITSAHRSLQINHARHAASASRAERRRAHCALGRTNQHQTTLFISPTCRLQFMESRPILRNKSCRIRAGWVFAPPSIRIPSKPYSQQHAQKRRAHAEESELSFDKHKQPSQPNQPANQ